MQIRLAVAGAWLGLALVGVEPLRAQTGTIAGQVIDAEANSPLPDATVQVFQAGGSETAGALSREAGRFTFEVPPGTYSVVVTLLGYAGWRADGIEVPLGGTAEVTAPLLPQAIELDPQVVTVGRQEEKALGAPATVSVVTADEIAERAAPTVVDHVKALPGVDAAQTGLQQANMVTRGFNNAFSGAMLVISDNRYARVPSLNVNVYSFIPTTNLDIDRVEVVLGPGAALYGPNAASGVLHLITSSPIDDPGTALNLAGGERSLFHGEFRHATRFSDRAGLKVSGQYFRGDDWTFTDPFEAAAREEALATDPDTRVGLRNFDSERFGGSLRFDLRPWEDGEVVFDAGFNQASQIELTGAGTAQAEDWTYSFAQARLRKGRFFVQGFGNFSNAGDSFLLRTGQSVEDNSFFVAGQVQHGFALGGDREDVIYGLDLQRTEPRTDGTITGRNEEDDTIDEIGGYVHSTTKLTETLDFIGALRLDHHNRLEDVVFSPRAALVLEPTPTHNLRLTYNRAFSTPTTNNLFLDLVVGGIPLGAGIGYDIRTFGTPESGLTFSPDCPGGVQGGLCMFTPFAPQAGALPANAAVAWNPLLNALAPPELAPFLPFLLSDAPAVGTVLRRFDPEGLTFVPDEGPLPIARLEPTITNTVEFGYKGLIGERVLLVGDVWRSEIEDFIGPLRVETPTVFLDPTTTAAFIQQQLTPLVEAGQITPEQLAGIVTLLTGSLAMVPIGTVAPDQTADSDILLAYRNVNQKVELWGIDLAAEVLLTPRFALKGTFSYVSDDCFDLSGSEDCENVQDTALNASKAKGAFGLAFEDGRSGVTAEGRIRSVAGFPVNSGVYVGEVEGYTVFDATFGYRLPFAPAARLDLTVTNLFDEEHDEFVGAPEIGRMGIVRLHYELP